MEGILVATTFFWLLLLLIMINPALSSLALSLVLLSPNLNCLRGGKLMPLIASATPSSNPSPCMGPCPPRESSGELGGRLTQRETTRWRSPCVLIFRIVKSPKSFFPNRILIDKWGASRTMGPQRSKPRGESKTQNQRKINAAVPGHGESRRFCPNQRRLVPETPRSLRERTVPAKRTSESRRERASRESGGGERRERDGECSERR